MSAVLAVLVIVSAIFGCACLALAQTKPWKSVYGAGVARRNDRTFLCTGYGLLALSFLFALARETFEMAVLLWPLALAVGAGAVTLTLTYAPEALKPLGAALNRVPDPVSLAHKMTPSRKARADE